MLKQLPTDAQTLPGNGLENGHAPLNTTQLRVASPSLRVRILPHILVLLAFTLLTTVATWPMLPQLGGYVIDKGDPLYSVWAMAWQGHALATDPLGIFDTNIMYPFKGTLTFDELSFTEAVLAAPLLWLSGNPVLSHNVWIFLSFVLSGYGVWLLVRELTGNGWAGLVAGAAFAFSFYRLNHLPHMTLITTQWMPFMLLAAYKLLLTRKWVWAWALAAFFSLQALSGHYLAFYSAMLLGALLLYYVGVERSLFSWWLLGKLAVVMSAAFLLMLPILLPYVQLQGEHDFKRNLFEAERFSNTLSSFLAVFRGNPLYKWLLSPFADPGPWSIERAAFPGLAVVVLGVGAVVWAWRGRKATTSNEQASLQVPLYEKSSNPKPKTQSLPSNEVKGPKSPRWLAHHAIFYALIALVSAFFSLGPSLQLTYASSNYDPNAIQRIIPLPYLLLHEWVPGFQSMRVVARIDVLTALALALLAGIGAHFVLNWLAAKWKGREWARFALPATAALLALLPVAESWSAPIAMSAVGTREAVPPVYRWLAEQPRTVIVEIPMAHYKRGDISVEMANLYQYYSAYHWHYTLNGSTTIRPFSYSALVRETEDCFPCPRSLDVLWAMGTEYVVVHLENLSDPQREDFLWRSTNPAGKVVGSFELVREFGPDRVYRLKGPSEISQLKGLLPPSVPLLLPDPERVTGRKPGDLVFGGYAAALAFYLRDHPQYGDNRLSFGQTILEPDPQNPPEYALLWADQDPALSGYKAENRLWENEFVALYKRGAVSTSAVIKHQLPTCSLPLRSVLNPARRMNSRATITKSACADCLVRAHSQSPQGDFVYVAREFIRRARWSGKICKDRACCFERSKCLSF